jgi:hypothetical protein
MHTRFITAGIFFLVLSAITACAPSTQRVSVSEEEVAKEAEVQRQYAIRQQIKYQSRLDRVSYPILEAAVLHCEGNTRSRLGVNISNEYVWDEEYRNAAKLELKVGEEVSIIGVTPGSAADIAGLQTGDVVVELNGVTAPTGKKGVKKLQKMLDDASEAETVEFWVARGEGYVKHIRVTPKDICYFPVMLSDSDAINAYADGENIVITKGMMRFTENDQELALVISHELAHNTMGHIDAKKGNFFLGSVLDVAAAAYGINTQSAFGKMAAGSFSQGFEAEADYVGLYYMEWSGYELDGAADFWRRMAAEYPGSIKDSYISTHPSTSQRFVEIEQSEVEINEKLVSGENLLPNMK